MVAVGAAATVAYAYVALGGLGILLLVRRQILEVRQQTRMELAPYLRADLAPQREGGTWAAAEVPLEYQFSFADFNPGIPPRDIFVDWRGDPEVSVYLWVSNQQTHPGGIANNVVIEMEFALPTREDSALLGVGQYDVTVHYIEPGRRIRYLIGSVSESIPSLSARIVGVTYFDMCGRRLSFAHGSASFDWVGADLVNHRLVFTGGEP